MSSNREDDTVDVPSIQSKKTVRGRRKARLGGGSDVTLLKQKSRAGVKRGDGGERLRNLIILLIGLSLFLISYWAWRLSRRIQHGFPKRPRSTLSQSIHDFRSEL